MTHTLISFLGKAAQSYRDATYDFGDGKLQETAFFGLGLARHIKPDRLVVLGTTGSMWDVLLISLNLDSHLDEALLNLGELAQQNLTSPIELEALEPAVSGRLGFPVALRLIPYGRTTEEQVEILQRMALDIAEGDTVTLDVTHGLRHLPMLAQMSALYLRRVKNVEVRGIYYGALDMTRDGLTPVMNLRSLLDIADWTGAVQSFDKDGDYGVFASLMQEQSPTAAGLLQKSAFYERTTRPGQARSKLRELVSEIGQQPLTGIGSLFAPTLNDRLSWHREDRLYLRQQALARLYLEHDDFLRAALLGFEAFITRLMQQQGMNNPDNWEQRDQVKKSYESSNKSKSRSQRSAEYQDYCRLRDLRNHLAHGNASQQAEIQSALANADCLREFIAGLFDSLLPINS